MSVTIHFFPLKINCPSRVYFRKAYYKLIIAFKSSYILSNMQRTQRFESILIPKKVVFQKYSKIIDNNTYIICR